MSMTLEELRDWHARRAGWNAFAWGDDGSITAWINERYASCGVVVKHPFPPTLDGADASFPKGWEWGRTPPRGDWCAVSLERGITEQTAYTGDKPRDLYELSKLAWEQEAAR